MGVHNLHHTIRFYAYLSVLLHQFKQYLSDNMIIYDENYFNSGCGCIGHDIRIDPHPLF